MNGGDLPDELDRWPKNPYDLLGVKRGDDELTLKRAYTRLIRRFKPEHHPQHFQRLREAYDQVLQFQSWSSQWSEEETDDSPDEVERPRSTPERPDALLDAWRIAEAGDEARAYQLLLAWERGDAASSAPAWSGYARLYWLARLFPAVDDQRTAWDWLLSGLKKTADSAPLWELLRREGAREPERLLELPIRELAESIAGRLPAELLLMRWEAAARLNRPWILAADLERWQSRLSREDAGLKGRLLITAIEMSYFISDQKPRPEFAAYSEEAERLCGEEPQLQHEMLRLDQLQDADGRWKSPLFPGLPHGWRLLRCAGVLDPLTSDHPGVVAVATSIAVEPREALERFDLVAARHPPYCEMLLHFLHEYCDRRGVEVGDLPNLRPDPAVPHELHWLQNADYAVIRPGLFEFCLEHNVPPTRAAELLEAALVGPVGVVRQTKEDLLLQTIFAVWRAAWMKPPSAEA